MAATHIKDEAKTKFQDTRQLLDELDALMDQMLALPINEQQENETSSSPPPAVVSATLTMLNPPPAPAPLEELPEALPMTRQRVVEHEFDDQSSESVAGNYETPLERSALVEEPMPALADVAAPPKVELLPLPAPIVSPRWRPDHVSYQFLLWINQSYDGGTRWLGKPGNLLRSRAGKAFLGFAGLALLGLAAAWLAKDWLGWN